MPPAARIAPTAPLHELEYVVVDVETTGNARGRADRVMEVAAVVVRDGRVSESFSSLVNPGRRIPPPIVRLTGITNAMVDNAPTFSEVADRVGDMLASRVFVAHNVGFDWAFVGDEMWRATGRTLEGERLCTVKLARRLLTHLPKRNLDAVTAHYGIHISPRHRAYGDAEATARVFEKMLYELGNRGVHTWSDLRALLTGKLKRRRRWSALPQAMTDWRIA